MHSNKKGTVVVEAIKGRLRLRWSWAKSKGGDGKRQYLSLELDDDPINRAQAELKAKIIEADLKTGQYDPTLRKYRSDSWSDLSLNSLFAQFVNFKKRSIRSTSLEKYIALKKHIGQFFGERSASAVTVDDCVGFRDWLCEWQSPITTNERLGLLSACFDWAIASKMLGSNPCKEVLKAFVVPEKQDPDPFSKGEVIKILDQFNLNTYYSYYADFVLWLFGTGCRFGEASALQWKHLDRKCSSVWIGESIGRDNERKGTKNNKTRRFELDARLQAMLLKRRPEAYQPDDLVFPSPRTKGRIRDDDFRDRAWVTILSEAKVPYRKLYSTRHTFVSHSLMAGQNPLEVCEITGHDKETMFEFYAKFVGKPKARALYWD